jgi:hypothetical protein
VCFTYDECGQERAWHCQTRRLSLVVEIALSNVVDVAHVLHGLVEVGGLLVHEVS